MILKSFIADNKTGTFYDQRNKLKFYNICITGNGEICNICRKLTHI